MNRCIAGVRRPGEPTRTQNEHDERDLPTVWFSSMASLAAVLSDDNRALLRTIQHHRPRSLTELAEITGRKVPNLSRTLRMMAGYGLVKLNRNMREIEPVALVTKFLVVLE
ncbi:HVO_A0114 family putative DNA-binding protein [Pseudomonas sp. YuFO8]|uniref:HVO_A0114 family putative DNA-binding protein n=1 Tax=Pseudomonas sp. YuFO8 TaxID=3095361 RepID=UPI002B249138|nr:helix-turn-helix domain-containing protein [Pseudomonas sp. YuFO8]MEB2620906.1 transcriptional regulator [Pseudomonas sp. YuFO8]